MEFVCEALSPRRKLPGTYAWEFQSYNQRDSDSKCFGLMVAGVYTVYTIFIFLLPRSIHTHTMESLETTVLVVWNAVKLMEVRSLEIHQLGFGHKIG